MNYIDISKQIMSGEKIFNIPFRVCFYARVSTDSDVQLNSLDSQLNYYKEFIKSKPLWTYVDGYVDEGISGVTVEKRNSFKKMICDAKLHKFDLIITKEVSRFARDLEDSIHYIRELKNAGVGVYFENQNINTFDSNSDLILNIMFNLAQDESRKISSRVRFGHKEAIKKGHVLGSSNITGYRKDNCKLVIVEEEAKFIRCLFRLYATGEYGFYKLSKKLGELGYFNKKGNLYDKDTIKRMIENPKYKGFYRGKTSEVIDYRTKKRKKIDIGNQVIYKSNESIVPPIVSETLWNKANLILNERVKTNTNCNCYTGGLKYAFSSKIYCKEHNSKYQRSHGSKKKNRPVWCCSQYLKYNLDVCTSPIILEKDLYNILKNIFDSIITNKDDLINEIFELYKSINIENVYNKELNIIKNKIDENENKKNYLIDLVLKGDLTREDLKNQFKKIEEESALLIKKKNNILVQIKIKNEGFNNNIKLYDSIKNEINDYILDGLIRKYVNRIVVSKINENRNNIFLDIYLSNVSFFSENESLYLECQMYETIETGTGHKNENKFTYNVYFE